jgi:GTP-binding protein EngB required for normal cell division
MDKDARIRETTEVGDSSGALIPQEVNPDLTHVEAYAKAKQLVGRDLHYVGELLEKRKSERRHAACHDLMVKLAEDHFTLAVLGQFKRGKSSLMNAVIGRPLLPTGVLPLTSAITILRFGPRDRLLIEYEGSTVVSEAPISGLAQYVTEKGNPGNRRRILRVVVETPSPFLRRGLEFVDTPGVGSAIEANTRIAQRFLPQCDAVIFVTGVDSPLSKTETDFLSQIRQHVRKVFFVVNKIDLLSEDERDEVLQFVSENLRSTMETESVRIFPVSCKDGLAARIQGNIEGYARSGVKSFEEALSEFLSAQRTTTFLVSILDRAIAIADEELRDMEMEARSAELSEEEVRNKLAALQKRLEDIRAMRERDLSGIRERVLKSIKQDAGRETRAIMTQVEESLGAEIDRAVTGPKWRLSRAVVRDLEKESTKRINSRLDDWSVAVAENLRTAFETSLRREIQALSTRFEEIPKAAAEVLGLEVVSSQALPELERFQIEWHLRSVPPRSLQLQPPIPLKLGFLPIFLTRSSVARHCQHLTHQVLEEAEAAVCEAVVAGIEEMLEETICRIRKLASKLEERVKAMVAGKSHSSSSAEDRQSQFQRLKELRARLCFLRDRIVQSDFSEADGIVSLPALPESTIPGDVAAPPKPSPAPARTGLSPDFRTRGCPVCDRLRRVMFDFFAHWQYELSASEASQSQFASEGGFCPWHTWQLADAASPQGMSRGFPRLISRISIEIARVANGSGDAAAAVLSLVQGSQDCYACRELRAAEMGCLKRLAESLQSPAGIANYNSSQGLCLRHLALLLQQDLPQDIKVHLLRHTSRVLDAIVEDMHSYVLKRDALRRGLHNQDEEDAYMRALIRLAGDRSFALPAAS